jgi:hypothetical protein
MNKFGREAEKREHPVEKCESCKGTGSMCRNCEKGSGSCKCDDRKKDGATCPDCGGAGNKDTR